MFGGLVNYLKQKKANESEGFNAPTIPKAAIENIKLAEEPTPIKPEGITPEKYTSHIPGIGSVMKPKMIKPPKGKGKY